MGEYISASIKIGGRIPKDHAAVLVEQLNSWDLTIEYNGDPITLATLVTPGAVFASSAVNYGNLDELTSWCDMHGLDWEHWHDSGSEWDPMIKRSVGGVKDQFVCDEQENVMVPLKELVALDALSTGWAKLHDRIKAWARPIPPLVIVP